MKLEDFISNKVEELMAFQEGWLESHKKNPERFPMEWEDEILWDAQYEFNESRVFLGALIEEAEKRAKEEKEAAKDDKTNASTAAA